MKNSVCAVRKFTCATTARVLSCCDTVHIFPPGASTVKYPCVSTAMITKKSLLQYQKGSANVYNPDWMRQVNETGDWKDAPKRTFIGKKYMEDGFSDHFPVYINLVY